MQFESNFARQHFGAPCQRRIKNVHTTGQRFKKAFFLDLQNLGDALFIGLQARVGVAHLHHQIGYQLVEKRRFFAQQVAVANRAADDAALHVAAAFVGRHHAVAHQKSRGTDVVGDHAQALVVQVFFAGLARGSLDQRVKDVDLVIAVHMLQDGGQALQAHAGVHAGRGQFDQAAVGLHVELHEHVVPDLNESVAIFAWTAGWAARDVRAMVVKNFGARAAGAGVSHHPEVV